MVFQNFKLRKDSNIEENFVLRLIFNKFQGVGLTKFFF